MTYRHLVLQSLALAVFLICLGGLMAQSSTSVDPPCPNTALPCLQ